MAGPTRFEGPLDCHKSPPVLSFYLQAIAAPVLQSCPSTQLTSGQKQVPNTNPPGAPPGTTAPTVYTTEKQTSVHPSPRVPRSPHPSTYFSGAATLSSTPPETSHPTNCTRTCLSSTTPTVYSPHKQSSVTRFGHVPRSSSNQQRHCIGPPSTTPPLTSRPTTAALGIYSPQKQTFESSAPCFPPTSPSSRSPSPSAPPDRNHPSVITPEVELAQRQSPEEGAHDVLPIFPSTWTPSDTLPGTTRFSVDFTSADPPPGDTPKSSPTSIRPQPALSRPTEVTTSAGFTSKDTPKPPQRAPLPAPSYLPPATQLTYDASLPHKFAPAMLPLRPDPFSRQWIVSLLSSDSAAMPAPSSSSLPQTTSEPQSLDEFRVYLKCRACVKESTECEIAKPCKRCKDRSRDCIVFARDQGDDTELEAKLIEAKEKLVMLQKALNHQVELPPNRLVCTECHRLGTACDKLHPCTPCTMKHRFCVYLASNFRVHQQTPDPERRGFSRAVQEIGMLQRALKGGKKCVISYS
jgi:hypothetical protein